MERIAGMKILVTGGGGQLGKAVVKELKSKGHEVVSTRRQDMDIAVEDEVRNILDKVVPDAVVHCAAYTNVDRAEEESAVCHRVNVCGTKYLVKWCGEHDTKFLYVSTDYVFSGEGTVPHGEEDEKNPLNIYGQSKHEGEELVKKNLKKWYIVRTSWLYGEGDNFVTAILGRAKETGRLQVVNDQIGAPTYTEDLAAFLGELIDTERYGIYHVTNEGECTRYEFACEILKQARIEARLSPVVTKEYPRKAVRPKNSRLGKEKLRKEGFAPLPHWKDALKRYMSSF